MLQSAGPYQWSDTDHARILAESRSPPPAHFPHCPHRWYAALSYPEVLSPYTAPDQLYQPGRWRHNLHSVLSAYPAHPGQACQYIQ